MARSGGIHPIVTAGGEDSKRPAYGVDAVLGSLAVHTVAAVAFHAGAGVRGPTTPDPPAMETP